MDEKAYLAALSGKPLGTRVAAYFKLSGPGYMQSAMTLGGGSIASCVVLGSLMGYELLWVQPLAIILGYFVLAALGKQALATGERPYRAMWERINPALALFWGLSALIATVLWHIPQYTLTASGIIEAVKGTGVDLSGSMLAKGTIGVCCLVSASAIVYMYNTGAKGLKYYELAVKLLVWSIVIAFAIVAFRTGIQWKRLFMGLTGLSFIQELSAGKGLPPDAIKPVVGGIAAAVGINMVFLYPYSLLNKDWGTKHQELAYFDLLSGMVLPFLLATTFMVVAVANTIGPEAGTAGIAVRNMGDIVPVLAESFGPLLAAILIGFGMFAIGFSTIITHMLASGFIGCEIFGFEYRGKAKFWFSLLPAVGVFGVLYPFPWQAAITASTLSACFMPLSIIGFIILHNMKSYMGSERPEGLYRMVWNFFLVLAVVVLSVASVQGLAKNWADLQQHLKPAAVEETKLHTAEPDASQEESEIVPDDPDLVAKTYSHDAMGTFFEFTLYTRAQDQDTFAIDRAAQDAFTAIDDLERRISSWIQGSDISYINAAAGTEPVKMSPRTMALLTQCQNMHEQTNGAFDITVGPLIELWGFYSGENRLPAPEELAEALQLVGLHKVSIDTEERLISFATPGMRLDLGGIGKGMALDAAADILRERGITSAVLNGGTSTVLAIGTQPGRKGWTVQIRNPYNRDENVDEVILRDESLSTSGGDEKFFEVDGVRYCHIFDPRTGSPVQGMASATAIVGTGTESDALSTAFFVMGTAKVEEYCRKHPEVRAILVADAPQVELAPIRVNFSTGKELS